jgi:hypothetical protein
MLRAVGCWLDRLRRRMLMIVMTASDSRWGRPALGGRVVRRAALLGA